MHNSFKGLLIVAVILFLVQNGFGQSPCTPQFPTTLDTRSTLCDSGDQASSALSSTINSSVTVVTVASTTKFPATGVLVIDSEQLVYTSKTSTTFTISVRGAFGTSATSHAVASLVKGALTAQHIHAQSDAQLATEAKIGVNQSGEQATPLSGTLFAGRGTGTSAWRTPAQLSLASLAGLTDTYIPYDNGGTLADSPLLRYGANSIGFAAGTSGPAGTGSSSARYVLYPAGSSQYLGIGVDTNNFWFNNSDTSFYNFYFGGQFGTASYNLGGSALTVNTGAVNTFLLDHIMSGTASTGAFTLRTNTETIRFSAGPGPTSWEINGTLVSNAFRPTANNFNNIGDSTHQVKDVHLRTTKYYGSTSGVTTVQASATAGTTTWTLPGVSDTFAGLAATQTFTNKTFTSPVINVGSDATADTYYRNSGGLFTRLAIGSNGNCLTVSSGLPAWGSCGSTSAGGSNTQLQFNNSGSFGGISGATTNGTDTTFGSGNLLATSPKITSGISDANGNAIVGLSPTTSAVNYFSILNAATGTGPILAGAGADTNVPVNFQTKGTGRFNFTTGTTVDEFNFAHQFRFTNPGTDSSGIMATMRYGATDYFRFQYNSFQIDQGVAIQFGTLGSGFDAGICRNTAGVVEFNNGTCGTIRDVKVRNLLATNGLVDNNFNPYLSYSTTTSAVNYFQMKNSVTGAGPTLFAVGADTNIDIHLNPKGSGSLFGLLTGGSFHVEGISTGVFLDLNDGSQNAELHASGRNLIRLEVDDAYIGDVDANDNGTNIHTSNSSTKITLTAASGGTTFAVSNSTGIEVSKTITSGATTGAQTINKPAGSVNFAAAGTSLVVTNSMVTANSVILCTVGTNDTTLKSVQCVAGSGSFTMFASAAATATTRVNFLVVN